MELMLRSWALAFFWTQLVECPVYLILQPRLMRVWPGVQSPIHTSSGHRRWIQLSLFDLGVGFGASLISHPPATALFWEVQSWSHDSSGQKLAAPYTETRLQRFLSQFAWETVEVGVFLVETLWLYWAHADSEGGIMLGRCGRYWFLVRAAACSLCANLTSIMVGVAIDNWAPHLLEA